MTATSDLPWVDPGAFEVAEQVWRVPLPLPNDGLRAVNVYVIATADGLVCVDAGWNIPESKELFVKALGQIGHDLSDVRRFLVTHAHRDHYTQAIDVRREVGSQVALGRGEGASLAMLQTPHRPPFDGQVARLRSYAAGDVADQVEAWAGISEDARDIWESPDTWLDGGPIALAGRTLEAVETPGHTRGHLVFHDLDAALLFAGDHVLPTITPSIGFETATAQNPLGAFLSSLAIVRARPDARLLPAHGPVTDSVHARVDELLAHHDSRLEQTVAAVRAGAATVHDIGGQLRWTRREHRLSDLDTFNSMLALFETGAHLDLLVAQGRLQVTTEAGLLVYAL
jgi:glyoxylase-like metal-dependent hydrolase (beta-lactamase superfamily II)